MKTRTLLKSAALALLAAVAPPLLAQADNYPSRPIKIIVPASTGIAMDASARYFAAKLAAKLNVGVNVENMPGVGGLMGYNAGARAKPDGYTLMFAGIPIYLLPLYPKEAASQMFDPIKSFTPIARVHYVPTSVAVPVDSPYKTLKDLVDAMKAKSGDIRYGSQGAGSSGHVCSAVLNLATGTKAEHILYKAASTAITDVVAGRIDFLCLSPTAWIPLREANKIRVLYVSGTERQKYFPDVPTVAEAGFPDADVKSQLEFMAPAGTPPHIVKLLEGILIEAASSDEFREIAEKQMFLRGPMRAADLEKLRVRENEFWKKAYTQIPAVKD